MKILLLLQKILKKYGVISTLVNDNTLDIYHAKVLFRFRNNKLYIENYKRK